MIDCMVPLRDQDFAMEEKEDPVGCDLASACGPGTVFDAELSQCTVMARPTVTITAADDCGMRAKPRRHRILEEVVQETASETACACMEHCKHVASATGWHW